MKLRKGAPSQASVGRKVQQRDVGTVRGHQAQVGVEDRQALLQRVQPGPQGGSAPAAPARRPDRPVPHRRACKTFVIGLGASPAIFVGHSAPARPGQQADAAPGRRHCEPKGAGDDIDAHQPVRTRPRPQPGHFVALTPLSFLARAAHVHPQRTAGLRRSAPSWAETHARCRRLASALAARGVGPGDTVACMLPNVPAMYEAHFGVPMTGAVLNTSPPGSTPRPSPSCCSTARPRCC